MNDTIGKDFPVNGCVTILEYVYIFIYLERKELLRI